MRVYAARADANQREIVEALRGVGATVQHLHTVGRGCPDLVVGFRGRNYLLELKSKRGRLTDAGRAWHERWRGQVVVVRGVDEALRAIGAISGGEFE